MKLFSAKCLTLSVITWLLKLSVTRDQQHVSHKLTVCKINSRHENWMNSTYCMSFSRGNKKSEVRTNVGRTSHNLYEERTFWLRLLTIVFFRGKAITFKDFTLWYHIKFAPAPYFWPLTSALYRHCCEPKVDCRKFQHALVSLYGMYTFSEHRYTFVIEKFRLSLWEAVYVRKLSFIRQRRRRRLRAMDVHN